MSDEVNGEADDGEEPGEQEKQPSMEPLTEQLKTTDDYSQLAGKTPLPTPPRLKLVVFPHRHTRTHAHKYFL